jgi:predicted enzyme related to lactoylglutathione lyase
MVDQSLARHGGLSYLEIPAADAVKSAAFYEHVLGWKVDRSDANRIKFADRTGHLIGRWCTGRPAAREPGLMAYFYVDRLSDAVAQVPGRGGEVARAPHPEGDTLISTVRDPAGNLIGLWQDANR